MRVMPCQHPPGVEIYGSAPQFNAKNFSHIFTHKAEYEVPGKFYCKLSFKLDMQFQEESIHKYYLVTYNFCITNSNHFVITND